MPLVGLCLLLGSFAISTVLTRWMRRLGPRVGLIDRPGGEADSHKRHAAPVPLGGGVAIVGAVLIVMLGSAGAIRLLGHFQPPWAPSIVYENLAGLDQRLAGLLILLGCTAGIWLLGLADDSRPLRPLVKFLGQLAVAVVAVRFLDLHVAEFLGFWPSILLAVLWIVTVCNAINFMDNMDGLAGGVVVLCGSILAATGLLNGQLFVPALLLVVIGATGGFLLHNLPPARIFMGDAGSQPLGFLLGVLTIQTVYTRRFEEQPVAVLMPLIILAIPLYDLLSVCLVRVAQRRRVTAGDRSHFSHRLLQRGLSTRAALLTIYLAVCATGSAALFLMQVPARLAWIVFAQTLCIVGIIALLEFGRGSGGKP